MNMLDNLALSKGFYADGFYIPPLVIKGKCYTTFIVDDDFNINHNLKKIISGKKNNENFILFKPINGMYEPWMKRNLFIGKGEKTVREYLLNFFGIETAELIAAEVGVNFLDKLETLGMNKKKILAFEAATTFSENIVFDTSGMDPVGVSNLHESAKKKLHKNSFIELNYNTIPERMIFQESIQMNIFKR
jgi:hypothetical protein